MVNRLYVKFIKCEFLVDSIAFLGNMVSKDGIMVDLIKIESIHDRCRPIYLYEVCSFIGLVGYNR